MVLTASQQRLLKYIATRWVRWVCLLELDQARSLEPDDVITVPSLVGRGLLMHLPELQAVALTPLGEAIADELRHHDKE